MWDVGSRLLYPVGLVCLCVAWYHLTLFASVALSVSVGVCLHGLSLAYDVGLRDLSGQSWSGGVKTVRVFVTLAKTGLRLHRTYLGCMLDSD